MSDKKLNFEKDFNDPNKSLTTQLLEFRTAQNIYIQSLESELEKTEKKYKELLVSENAKLQSIIYDKRLQKLKEILDSFDWEIRGNHALTATCTRLTDEQIEQLNPSSEG